MTQAFLVLDDGRIFEGRSWGAIGRTFGEAVFQTGMTGYQETLTDPSYHKQVVVMTAPMSLTLYLANVPRSKRPIAALRAV